MYGNNNLKLHNGENSSLRKDSRSIKEGLSGVLGNKRTLAKYLRKQGNVSLFSGNRGTKLFKLKDENILI